MCCSFPVKLLLRMTVHSWWFYRKYCLSSCNHSKDGYSVTTRQSFTNNMELSWNSNSNVIKEGHAFSNSVKWRNFHLDK